MRCLRRPILFGTTTVLRSYCSPKAYQPPVAFDIPGFTAQFLAQIKGIPIATDPSKSSKELRKLVKSKVLKFTDMSTAPEKFRPAPRAHRLLSTVGGSGFGIRFTVQFNLFAGPRRGTPRCINT